MTMFLCIAMKHCPPDIRSIFDNRFFLEEVTDTPFGRAAIGNSHGVAFLVSINGKSWCLDRSNQRLQPSYLLFADAIDTLCISTESVSIIAHWFRGQIMDEALTNVNKTKLSRQEFRDLFPDLCEDTRYVVLNC